jgi:hypothetical protein
MWPGGGGGTRLKVMSLGACVKTMTLVEPLILRTYEAH